MDVEDEDRSGIQEGGYMPLLLNSTRGLARYSALRRLYINILATLVMTLR
jgi:hypothetical protein